jgi:Tfp pilus assembly pilus retraction ATPase PilT
MLEINEMLKIVVERDAADLHLRVGKQPVMRLHGIFDVIDPDILTPEDTERLMRENHAAALSADVAGTRLVRLCVFVQ